MTGSDHKGKRNWIDTVDYMAAHADDNLLAFEDLSEIDIKELLVRLGFAAYRYSEELRVAEERKQELQDRIQFCAGAFENKAYSEGAFELFQFGRKFERYFLEAHRTKKRRDNEFPKDAPFINYVINRANTLWESDSKKLVTANLMSKLLEIEVKQILEKCYPVLMVIGSDDFKWLKTRKPMKATPIKGWVKAFSDMPDYANPRGIPGKEKTDEHARREAVAKAHKYALKRGEGELFGYELPIDLIPPNYS